MAFADDILEKRDGESDLDYHRRIINAKLRDKLLGDVSYQELSYYLYGQKYSEDVCRRMAYGSCKTLDMIDDNAPAYKDDVDTKIEELTKARQQYYDQRREYNKLVSRDGRYDHLKDVVCSAAMRVNESTPLISFGGHNYDCYDESSAVLVFNDWHYGMVCDNIYNTYNTDICVKRVETIVDKAIERIELHNVRDLHIVLLGDFIHGNIHVSARVAAEELMVDQLIQVSEILAIAIDELSKHVEHVTVHCTYGNHGRAVPNKKESIHRDNFERVIGWWLKERLSENNYIDVMNEGDTELLIFNVNDHAFVASHGDLDNVRNVAGTLPVILQKKYKTNVEYIILGDKHHREEVESCGIAAMVAGSVCGSDDYANSHRLYSTPEQLLLIVNGDGVDATYHLKCE